MEDSFDYPKVSVITPSYNQGKFVEKTILSVIGQDYPNLEYIILDSASTDDTGEILERYYPYINTIIREKDNGQADALNRGFQLCNGEILAYLNSDDCYASATVISTAVKHFQAHPEVDVVYGQRYLINEEGYFYLCYPTRPFCKPTLYLNCYMCQECVFWRRSIYERAGGFIDDSFQFAMDYELWLRFLKFGANFKGFDNVFGLFRSYENQKSTAQWQQFGLPEIERLYKQYADRCLPEAEMIDAWNKYFYGVSPTRDPALHNLAASLWGSLVMYKRNLLKRPLDVWGFDMDLSRRNSKFRVS